MACRATLLVIGTLRRPRLRDKQCPAGFSDDPVTQEQTLLAVRTAFVLLLAFLAGCYVSCEQPGASVMFELHIFRVLLELGCRITRFPFCSFGSGFNKPSKWLHNKPWLLALESRCNCQYKGAHFVIEGSFTKAAIREVDARRVPSCEAVYGKIPVLGQSKSSFSAAYPLPLCRRMAAGSLAAHREKKVDSGVRFAESCNSGFTCATESVVTGLRAWHEDPEWVQDLFESLPYREFSGTDLKAEVISTFWNAAFTSHG